MSGSVANELSAFACGIATADCEFDSGTFPVQLRRTLRNGFYLLVDQDPVFIVGCQLPWAVEDGQRVVEVAMDLDRGLDVMAPVPVRGDLQFPPLERDTVVASDDPVELFAQEVIEVGSDPFDEGRPLFERRLASIALVGVIAGAASITERMLGGAAGPPAEGEDDA